MPRKPRIIDNSSGGKFDVGGRYGLKGLSWQGQKRLQNSYIGKYLDNLVRLSLVVEFVLSIFFLTRDLNWALVGRVL